MWKRNKDEEEEKEQPVEEVHTKYQKPKILLVDLPTSCLDSVQSAGYNVLAGSFGSPYDSPYKTGSGDEYELIVLNHNLPNYTEQEIVFIDLTPPQSIDISEDEMSLSGLASYFWITCGTGKIDPRPYAMSLVRESFDRIFEHGGVFVVFAQYRLLQEALLSGDRPRHGFGGMVISDSEKVSVDNWSFLSVLSSYNLEIQQDSGGEMSVNENAHKAFPQIARVLESNTKGVGYTATFGPGYNLGESDWVPVLDSKFGDCVGALIIPETSEGIVLILPQIQKKEEAILALLRDVLPGIRPSLFPDTEGARWVERSEYELNTVLEYKERKVEIRKKAEAELEELDEKILEEREKLGFLHGVITKTGDDLVLDVKTCLERMGFKQVIDVDAQMLNDSEQGDTQPQEDLQIHDKSPTLLLEIKGISGPPHEDDTMQVVKYVPRRMREWKRTDVRGVSIVNHQRNLPTLERDNENVFTRPQIKDAENHDITLLTTWDLFLLVRGMLKWEWNPEAVQQLLYKTGRMSKSPAHYKPIGKITKYFPEQKVISVEICRDEDCELQKGDRIGYIADTEYLEEEASSLQIEKESVEKASPGQKVGIKTEYSQKLLRKGMIVYKVIK